MSEETTQSPTPSGSGIDRRKVLRASAWAAPVVLIATAVPAAAASPTCLAVSGSFVSWGEPYIWFLTVRRTVTIRVTFTVREGCTVRLNAIPQSALSFARGSTNFPPDSITGLPITVRSLAAGTHQFTITATVERLWFSGQANWPNVANLVYTSDSNNGTVTIPLSAIAAASLKAEATLDEQIAAKQAEAEAPAETLTESDEVDSEE